MKVGHRLYLAILPSAIGVFLVVAFAYWGQYGRQAPGVLVAVGAIGVLTSLVVAWRAARHVAVRIERLAMPSAPPSAAVSSDAVSPETKRTAHSNAPLVADELDVIEGVLDHLSSEIVVARDEGDRREERATRRAAEYAFLLDAVTGPIARHLEQVQLPLHVLLTSRFGELNENQEEMIEAARRAADAADADLRRVKRIREIDQRGLHTVVRGDASRPLDIMRSPLAIAEACAAERQVRIVTDLSPALPRVLGDRYQIEEAITSALRVAVEGMSPGGEMQVRGSREIGRFVLEVQHGADSPPGVELLMASRLIAAQGGSLTDRDGLLRISLPVEGVTA